MKKLLAMVIVLGIASVASADLVLTFDGSDLGVDVTAGDNLYGIDATISIVSGTGSIAEATTFGVFGGAAVAIAPVAGNTDQDRRYSGAAIVAFGGTPIVGEALVIGGAALTRTGPVTIQLIASSAGGTVTELSGSGGFELNTILDEITIPEPMTMSLLGLGGLALIRRRR